MRNSVRFCTGYAANAIQVTERCFLRGTFGTSMYRLLQQLAKKHFAESVFPNTALQQNIII